jgi:nitrate/nitrite-specific signal transduction histidine kinase
LLRRRLLFILGSLVALLAIMAVSALLLLNDVLQDIDRASTEAREHTAMSTELAGVLASVESELVRLRRSGTSDRARLEAAVADLRAGPLATRVGAEPVDELVALLEHHVDMMTTGRLAPYEAQVDAALAASVAIRDQLAREARVFQHGMDARRAALNTKFRRVLIGLAVVFLVVINTSIVVVLRAAIMVLRPVDELVEASRHLAQEDFEYRLATTRKDEFGELARATNHLAEQLEQNEQRKLEVMRQVARTLNHELNNAISIIDLQLRLVARGAPTTGPLEDRLQQIHKTLGRMTRTVAALKQVRRIVLTDYTSGVKMLDLERSVEPGLPSGRAETTAGPSAPDGSESWRPQPDPRP